MNSQDNDGHPRNKKWFLGLMVFVGVVGCHVINTYTQSSLETASGASSRKLSGKPTPFIRSREVHKMLPPVALITVGGCSGSSPSFSVLKRILKDQGYPVLQDEKEVLKPWKNEYYEQSQKVLKKKLHRKPTRRETLIEAMGCYHDKAKQNQSTLIFATQGTGDWVFDILDSLEAKSVFEFRGDLVSRAICRIRDCFGSAKDVGYPVLAENGTRTDLCFKRRKVNVETKVHVSDVSGFIEMMEADWEKSQSNEARQIRNMIYPSIPASYESLFAFEFTDERDAFWESFQEWRKLLLNIIDVDERILEETLLSMQNTRLPPPPVSDLIYNWEEVKDALGPDWETSWTVNWKGSPGVNERQ